MPVRGVLKVDRVPDVHAQQTLPILSATRGCCRRLLVRIAFLSSSFLEPQLLLSQPQLNYSLSPALVTHSMSFLPS